VKRTGHTGGKGGEKKTSTYKDRRKEEKASGSITCSPFRGKKRKLGPGGKKKKGVGSPSLNSVKKEKKESTRRGLLL